MIKKLLVLALMVLTPTLVMANENRDRAVEEGKNAAYFAGTGALACSATNIGANLLGLDSKWAAVGTMLVGNAAMIALTDRGGDRGNVDVVSRTVGCTLGTAGSTAGVYLYKAHQKRNALERDELFKETKEIKSQNAIIQETMVKHFSILDTRLDSLEKPTPVSKKKNLTSKNRK